MLTVSRDLAVCRICESSSFSHLITIPDLAIPSFPEQADQPVLSMDCSLVSCDRCGLVQLSHTLDQDLLYRHHTYRSGTNASMKAHLMDLATRYSQHGGGVVLDIGCNDGTLLHAVPDPWHRIGVDPSEGLDTPKDIEFINDYFHRDLLNGRKADLIFSLAMLYDLDNPMAFIHDVASCLSPTGLWVIEVNYLLTMLEELRFDHICHEHLTYLSLSDLLPMFRSANLQVTEVRETGTNGGSLLLEVRHAGMWDVGQSLVHQISAEQHLKRLKHTFPARMHALREHSWRWRERTALPLWVYGASTRGLTLLSWFGLEKHSIEAATEKSSSKVGRFYANTGIPIVSEEEFRWRHPPSTLVLPYSYIPEFAVREARYLKRGGTFYHPLTFQEYHA